MHEYTRGETLLANTPYAAMVGLGAAIFACGLDRAAWSLAAAAGYVAYGLAGAVWIMVFVCPYCAYYGNRGCPCGYGVVAARLVRKGALECFAQKFKRHIPVIVPLWLLPAVAGAVALYQNPSTVLGILVGAFAVDAFVILPMVSRRHSCSECPQKDDCPWMAQLPPVPHSRLLLLVPGHSFRTFRWYMNARRPLGCSAKLSPLVGRGPEYPGTRCPCGQMEYAPFRVLNGPVCPNGHQFLPGVDRSIRASAADRKPSGLYLTFGFTNLIDDAEPGRSVTGSQPIRAETNRSSAVVREPNGSTN